ncbi:MAG: hypothetical protein IPP62_04205 [bacterium]|nr:hypothetical protein [bacterium]
MAKKFMFICFGILALAGAYAVGANNSVAQVGGSDVVHAYAAAGGLTTVVVTANGDFYARLGALERYAGNTEPSWGMDGRGFSKVIASRGQ